MRPLTLAMAGAATLAALRGLPFILWPHAAFDSDQAIVGLMAKHLAEGRALPLFYYGQPYMLAVQAWLVAPLFLVGGASVELLKIPLVALNAAVAALLVWIFVRHAELSPARAFAASAFFVLCPPVAGAQLVAAMGGSVEPFLYVLLIWLLRDRPALCGLVAGIGFLHREFVGYGLAALVLTVTLYQLRQWRQLAGRWLLIGAVFLLVLEVARVARPFGDMFGPEMPKLQGVSAVSNLEAIAVRVECPNGLEVGPNLRWLFAQNLPTLAGTAGTVANEFVAGPATSPNLWVWRLLCIGLLVIGLRAVWLAWAQKQPIPPVLIFLFLIGVQTAVVYVSRCGVRDPTLIRYTLLTILIPVAVTAAYLRLEHVRSLRWAVIGLVAAWMAWSSNHYLLLVADYMAHPPISRQAMAAELERRSIRYGYARYWDAHYITFVTNERVVLAPLPRARIYTYDAVVWHAPDKVYVQAEPCAGDLIGSLWLCHEGPPPPAAVNPPIDMRFPPLHESLQFRQAVETKYRQGLGRQPTMSPVDVDAAVEWAQAYIRYRMSGCGHQSALLRVFMQIDGQGAQPTCDAVEPAPFPPREELVVFRRELEKKYRDGLGRQPTPTFVDTVGDIVWTSEYVRLRINGCAHRQASDHVMQQIDGGAPIPKC